MKEFNLELAKAGHPVCTRDGKPARIICFDLNGTKYPIATVVTFGDSDIIIQHTNRGKRFENSKDGYDLMMDSVKKKGWINIYRSHQDSTREWSNYIYQTKDEALKYKCDVGYITTIKIEWEE